MIKMVKLPLLIIVLLFCVGGCVPPPRSICQIDQPILESRSIQTRLFNTADEIELLTAGVSVLQDLGFHIYETEAALGMVRASKETDATDKGQVALAIAVLIINGQQIAIDDNQIISASFITYPSKNSASQYYARIVFQQLIKNTNNMTTVAKLITTDELYQQFFTKLSKAVFLEANEI